MKNDIPWFIKYQPKKFSDLIFSSDVHFDTLKWLKNWKKGQVLELKGSVGSGKTTLALAVTRALKYNPIEYSSEDLDLKKYCNQPTGTLDNKKNLLIIDEPFINPYTVHVVKKGNVPVILTTSELYIKNVETLKVPKPTYETILKIVKKISKEEDFGYTQASVLKTIKSLDFDIRAVINFLQLTSRSKTKTPIFLFKHDKNIFQICKNIFKSKLPFSTLEAFYSSKTTEMCLNFALENIYDLKQLSDTVESFSASDLLLRESEFLPLCKLNEFREPFIYKPSENCSKILPSTKFNPKLYFPLYDKVVTSEKACDHLRTIFKKFKFSDEEKENFQIRENYNFLPQEQQSTFKYKYSRGSTTIITMDISLNQLLKRLE